MKFTHLTILFVAIFLIIVIRADITTDNLNVVTDAKTDMDYFMDQALESAVKALMDNDAETGDEILNKNAAVDSFFSSMYASLGILSDPKAQEQFRAYVPVIVVTDYDGYYILYNDIFTGSDGYSYVSHRWTEKMPYYYEDTNFIYRFTLNNDITILDKSRLLDPTGNNSLLSGDVNAVCSDEAFCDLRAIVGSNSFLFDEQKYAEVRQTAMITRIEKDLSWYVSKHNDIASRYGITYQFTLPVTNTSEWAKAIESPGLVVIFQGMPLVEGLDRTYNRIAFTGAGYRKEAVYYIEQRGWYYLYHREGCSRLLGNLNVRDETYHSIEEVSELGCFACGECDPLGVQAPTYTPISSDNTKVIYSIKDWDDTKAGLLMNVYNLSINTAGGNLIATVTGPDSSFTIDYGLMNASVVDVVRVYAKITGNWASFSQLYFTPEGIISESRSCSTSIKTDGKWQWIEFNVEANPYWDGSIHKLQFDLIGDGSEGGRIEINEIKLLGDRED